MRKHTATFLFALILMLAFSIATVAQQPTQTPAKQETAKQYKKDGSEVYYCNAPTKAGGKCKRHVKAKGDLCFMHKK